ncbi:MAG: GIY-YIG nuclease family protein [Candidatus Omnitrophica bacterium]|nr:GIY-YIG nuclease family protein [Candidatus Omnitrophota bacterium]
MKEEIRRYLKYDFAKACRLQLSRGGRGTIAAYRPQKRYRNLSHIPLHKYGRGNFCKFGIPAAWKQKEGVYLIVLNGEVKYVGECVDLHQRFYDYGTISPRKCFEGGQPTNCKINKLILRNAGEAVDVLFCLLPEGRKEAEKKLIEFLKPPWNGRL